MWFGICGCVCADHVELSFDQSYHQPSKRSLYSNYVCNALGLCVDRNMACAIAAWWEISGRCVAYDERIFSRRSYFSGSGKKTYARQCWLLFWPVCVFAGCFRRSLWQEKVIARFLGRIDHFCMHDNVYVCYFCKNTGRTLYMDAAVYFDCPVFYII